MYNIGFADTKMKHVMLSNRIRWGWL